VGAFSLRKVRGEGLHIPLESFHVSLMPGEPERLQSADSEAWTLRSFQPAHQYVAAAVAEGKNGRVRHLRWVR